ncbi:MAG: hypothetical protein ACI4UE_04550 [Candidatus Scatovivens sp.]
MEENSKENNEDYKKNRLFEGLKNFFQVDMKIKESLLQLAPSEIDDYNEETRIEYTDKLYRNLKELETEFINCIQELKFESSIKEAIESHFNKARESFLISRYDSGTIRKLYAEQFSDMNPKLIEEVKEKCVGYTLRKDLGNLIDKSKSINELLHVMHSFITNDDKLLQSMPVIATKENSEGYPITLYGTETELTRELFEHFPNELDCGDTDIISMEDKILMMIRDRGHALMIDIDTSKNKDTSVKYFIPKLCNRAMVEMLPGIDLQTINEYGANGTFEVSKEEMVEAVVDFIGQVPMDKDIIKPEITEEVSINALSQNALVNGTTYTDTINIDRDIDINIDRDIEEKGVFLDEQ